MNSFHERLHLIERYCAQDDLRTYDPYDIWKTRLGFLVKDLFNRRRLLGLLPAAGLTLFDMYPNNETRFFYDRQEYPIVRAWAALILLQFHTQNCASALPLTYAQRHLDWLQEHQSPGYSGACWGIGFRQPIMAGLIYEASTPLATMTPYALEAFIQYHRVTGDDRFNGTIQSIHAFFDQDLYVMEETDSALALSYSPMPDRRVINVGSYVMLALALLLPYISVEAQDRSRRRIAKLFRYLVAAQRADGSWLYSPDGPPFIDCFHSCIVLKNLIKVDSAIGLPGAKPIIRRGYEYVISAFRDGKSGLYRRFTLENKPSAVRFDLYDNAEVIGLATLMGEHQLARQLEANVARHFVRGTDIYSQIDLFGLRHNRNTLRWAVMPYLHSLAALAHDGLTSNSGLDPLHLDRTPPRQAAC